MFVVNMTNPIDDLQVLKDATLEYESSVDFLLEQSAGKSREERGQILAKLAREGYVKVVHPPENRKWCDIEVTEVRI